jgi:hypothetical protein
MMRFALRLMTLIFISLVLLLNGIIDAAGGQRPSRFLLVFWPENALCGLQ